jgi:phage protein U
MAQPLYQLGSFQFDLPNGVPQTLERVADYRWEGQDRILREPAYQFVGPGNQEATLDGVLYPGFSGRQSTMETLRTLAAEGKPQMFSDGTGRVWGKWCIASIREGLGVFAPGGGARQIAFSIRLVRYGEDNPGAAAAPTSVSSVAGAVDPFAGTTDLTAGFQLDASAFKTTEWARNLPFDAPALAAATKGAGFGLSDLATIARSIGNGDYVGAALNAFGLAGLTIDQSNIWTQLGINAAEMVQQMATGGGPPTLAVALEALRPVTNATLNSLAGSIGGADGLRNMINDAATIITTVDRDPHRTAQIRQALQIFSVLSSSEPVIE